jgi:uncharacterized membrane protein YhhN
LDHFFVIARRKEEQPEELGSLSFVLGFSFVTQNERTYVAIAIATSNSVGPSWGCVVIFLVVGYMLFFTCVTRVKFPRR